MEKKFIWYGLNKQFNDIVHSHSMTTTDLLNGNYPSWMALKNRGENGNCDFLAECFFTGQKDKNGKEIFEGDILKSECGKLGKIEWLNNRTAFCVHWYLQLGSGDIEYCVLNMKLEIIGNKYENPELLSTPTAVL
jgi:hypothetical protein